MVQRWIILALLAAVMGVVSAFLPQTSVTGRRPRTMQQQMAIDPNDVLHHHPHVEALLSTLYAQALKPAHEHSQSLFGPLDPYLSAGKSIIPSQNAFVDAGLADTVKSNPLDVPNKVVEAISKTPTKFVIDPKSVIRFDKVLPGFSQTGHFLPQQSDLQETDQSLILEMGSIAKLMRVVNVLPMVAFLYTCAEFFLVKPGYDAYKEELEEDGAAANVEFMALTGIRLAILSVVGVLTLTFFGK